MARFRTKARAVDLLGKQQIRDEITAISELLRNSYDADADEGLIDVNTKNDRIIVWDDGDGMDETDIIENWLTIGTYSKKVKEIKPSKKNRIKIGEKGIGRLAISLLGDQLLLISKKKEQNTWSVLYLHWELFRNENLFMEDIELPTRSFISLTEVVSFLKNSMQELKVELLNNLMDSSKWDINILTRIKHEINSFQIQEESFGRLRLIDKRGGGTFFYVSNIENDWDWNIYLDTQVEDESRRERRIRLENVLVSFTNLIDLFDRKEQENVKDKFTPKLNINGEKIHHKSWFNPDDIQLFDYALKGTIKDGYFSGTALIKNSNETEEDEQKDINLNSGIHTANIVDIGPVNIKWFFVEGTKDNSALPANLHEIMDKKLETSGGIYVFRDGLRILPYGELGNDFLRMEQRRSKSAGYYLFSHRRIYGFIEISKINNPKLIDKSSREGFVENAAYKYLQAVAINLLKWWAIDYLGTKLSAEGKRAIRIKRLKEDREREMKANERQREEEKRQRNYFKNLELELGNFSNKLSKLYQEIGSEIENRLNYHKRELLKGFIKEGLGSDSLYSLTQKLNSTINKLDEVRINYNLRYFHSPELMDRIDSAHHQLMEKKQELLIYINNELDSIRDNTRKSENEEQDDNNHLENRLNQAIQWINQQLPIILKKNVENKLSDLRKNLNFFEEDILNSFKKRIEVENKEIMTPLLNQIKLNGDELSDLFDKVTSLDYYLNKEDIELETKGTLQRFENLKEEFFKNISAVDFGKDQDYTKDAINAIEELRKKITSNDSLLSDDVYIGFLKQEVELYRDLSAVGLAAELTSHEFNALYQSIRDNLDKLQLSLANTSILPLLKRTISAFRSLERLHQRMSPLYRQVRARKGKINLREFIYSVLEYFNSDLDRFGIEAVVKIDETITIRENDSVLFTPVVNLVSNAIYWLLSSEKKQIYFYITEDGKSLYIHDSGPGINIKDLDRIFDPYFTKKVNGRGLGLFLSRDILEARGHKLYLVQPGQEIYPIGGACFCIEFSEESRGVVQA